jgi:hypothetical protein
VGCRALILAPRFKSSDYLEILGSVASELRVCEPGELRAAALPDLRWVIRLGEERTPGMLNLGGVMSAANAAELTALEDEARRRENAHARGDYRIRHDRDLACEFPERHGRLDRASGFHGGPQIARYIRFVDAFPMTVTGKVQKYLIREQMKRELGLDEERTA